MVRADTLFSEEKRRCIAEAIATAEAQTSAEIVCAVATESGRYDRAEGICGILVAVISLGLTNFFVMGDYSGATASGQGVSHSWSDPVGLGLFGQIVAICLGYVAGNLLASYCQPLRRLFVSNREMEDETARSASRVFLSQRVRSTRQAGGVLIYVSLFERRVVVLADDGIMQHDGQAVVETARDTAIAALRVGKFVETFVTTIAGIAGRLQQVLPVEGKNDDELPNELRSFHPRP